MHFFIQNYDLLKKYKTIWNNASADIEKEFSSKLVYNKEFWKTKIKSHGNKVTDFYYKKVLKEGSNYTCLAVITLDSALKKK